MQLHRSRTRLKDTGSQALPRGPRLHLLALPVDKIPVQLTTAGINVHLSGPEPTLALPEVSRNPKGRDDERGEVGLEELRGSTCLALNADW